MHVILGDGEMPKRALITTLEELRDKAADEDDTFWLLVQAKPEPTATDKALMGWVRDNSVWFEIVGDGSWDEDTYAGAQETHTVKRLAPKVVSLMQSKPEEGEEADVLALFASDDPEAEEDRWLNEAIQAVMDEDFKVLALNDGLVAVTLSTQGEEPEAEPEQPEEPEQEPEEPEEPAKPAPAKKSASKKAAAPPRAEKAEKDAPQELSREYLEGRTLEQLKEIATRQGVTVAPRSRMGTYIDAILGESDAEGEVEVDKPDEVATEAVSSNGDQGIDMDDLVVRVVREIASRLSASTS